MPRILAIDPGDKHVGWAYAPRGFLLGVAAVQTGEWRPGEAVNAVVHMMTKDMVAELVVEEFVLYEDKAREQSWSKLQTPQLIGALKVIAYFFRIPVVEQPAYIKKPTRAQMRGRGIRVSRGSIHAKDAELHLVHRLLRSQS